MPSKKEMMYEINRLKRVCNELREKLDSVKRPETAECRSSACIACAYAITHRTYTSQIIAIGCRKKDVCEDFAQLPEFDID